MSANGELGVKSYLKGAYPVTSDTAVESCPKFGYFNPVGATEFVTESITVQQNFGQQQPNESRLNETISESALTIVIG